MLGPLPGQRNPLDKHLHPDILSPTKLWDYGPQTYDEKKFNDYVDAEWAIRQMAEKQEKPFFMALGFYRPHVPFYAPARLFKEPARKTIKLPAVLDTDREDIPDYALQLTRVGNPPPHQEWFVEKDEWRYAVQSYLACIRFVDEQVGRVLDALDNGPHKNNTIILFFSDHGFHLGEKQRWAKVSLWERSTRVPFMMSVPDGLKGAVCRKPVELLSIYPTLTGLCGITPKTRLDGVSLEPLLKDPEGQWDHAAITTLEQNNHAVRSEDWRYIRYADGSEELYDHRKDPDEWRNLADDPALASVIEAHRKWIPRENVPAAEGTRDLRREKKIPEAKP